MGVTTISSTGSNIISATYTSSSRAMRVESENLSPKRVYIALMVSLVTGSATAIVLAEIREQKSSGADGVR